jgi:histidinol-phosphatase (PHP family)
VHSNNSFDAVDSVIQLCEGAIKNGVNGFVVTDHIEAQDYSEDYGDHIEKSHKDVEAAQKLFEGKLKIRKGMELGQPHQNIEAAEKILKRFPCDFIIGSMHNVKDEKDFHNMHKEEVKERFDELITKYYNEYYEMTKWGKFDVIGHITYPLRYIEGDFGIKVDMKKYNEIIFEMLKLAVKKDIGIEVNVSGFRQNYGKQFPNIEHIQAYKDFGGQIITIGSDSHNRYNLGENFKEGQEILKTLGFKHYVEFENRKPIMIDLMK